jgi:glycogen debranching enzyme
MPLEISVGPPRLTINHGQSVLITEQDGQIQWPTDKGLYDLDTRIISSWRIFADGETWDLLNSGNITHCVSKMFLINRPIATQTGDIPAGSIGLEISRCLTGGMHEDIDLVNHGAKAVEFNLEIAIRSDFADLFEVKAGRIVRRGQITTEWSPGHAHLRTTYLNQDFRRGVTVLAKSGSTAPVYANGRISFAVRLEPGEAWHTCLLYEFGGGEDVRSAPVHCVNEQLASQAADHREGWRDKTLKITTSNEEFYRFYAQAIEDMAALRLPIAGTDHLEFVPAAGVPWFVGLFGRDSLIVSLQNSAIYPNFARGSLDVLGSYQARERDDYRDAEPGKIMHELRTGELAHFKLIPHTPYYGTADATPLYLIVLHNAWRWTGDATLLDQHMETAERCLSWIDQFGDRDGDGFQEYQTRSSAGYENMGWKDSGEALVNLDGSLVKGPKALCELQGYVYDAWVRMADIYDARGAPDRAAELRAKADTLFRRFNESFWNEELGFYAFALDGDKKPVWSVASNPGHCLWSGIVPRERAERVARRLMAPDMWSGWGIRTLSSAHRAYDPHSYQRGSVWPHDNGLIALGFRRYGLAREAAMIARDVSEAASFFMQHRMPELYAGLQRAPTTFPVQYKGANVPQAWAAGSCFSLLTALLGLQPDAPNAKLYIDPFLPEWLPDILLEGLRIGDRSVDVSLWRDGTSTAWKVIKGDPSLIEARSCAVGPRLDPSGLIAPDQTPKRTELR